MIEVQTWKCNYECIISRSEISLLKTLAYLKRNMCSALRSKYGLCSYGGIDAIKHAVAYSRIFPLLLW